MGVPGFEARVADVAHFMHHDGGRLRDVALFTKRMTTRDYRHNDIVYPCGNYH